MSPQQSPNRPDPRGGHCSPREVLTGIPGPRDFRPPAGLLQHQLALQRWCSDAGPEAQKGGRMPARHQPHAGSHRVSGLGEDRAPLLVKHRPGKHGTQSPGPLPENRAQTLATSPGLTLQPPAKATSCWSLPQASGRASPPPVRLGSKLEPPGSPVRGGGGGASAPPSFNPRLAESALGNNGLTPAIPAPSHVQI